MHLAKRIHVIYPVPSSSVRNPAIAEYSSSTVSLTWNPPEPENRNGPILYYDINVTVSSTGNTFLLTSLTEYLNVTSLRPYTTYIFRIAAVTEVGAGPYSTSLSVTTLSTGTYCTHICIDVNQLF